MTLEYSHPLKVTSQHSRLDELEPVSYFVDQLTAVSYFWRTWTTLVFWRWTHSSLTLLKNLTILILWRRTSSSLALPNNSNHSHSLKMNCSLTLLNNVNHSHSLKIDFQQSHTSEEREPFSFFVNMILQQSYGSWLLTPWDFHTIVSRSKFHRVSFIIGRFTIQAILHYSMRSCWLLAIVSTVTVLIDIVVHRCESKPRRQLIHLEQTLFFRISML